MTLARNREIWHSYESDGRAHRPRRLCKMTEFAPRMRRLFARSILALIAVAGLTACAAGPNPPLMSPLTPGVDYGYTEEAIGDGRYKITYATPSLRTALDREQRKGDTAWARALALDLATWRAAELARAEGFKAFRIDDRRVEIEVVSYDDAPRFPNYYFDQSLGANRYPPHGLMRPLRSAWLQARAILTITLTQKSGDDALDVKKTIERMSRKHPEGRLPPSY